MDNSQKKRRRLKIFFQRLKKFFHALKNYFQALEIFFHGLAFFLKIMQERRGAFSLLLCGLENLRGKDSPWWDAVKKNAHRVKNNSRYVKILLHGIYFDRDEA